MGSPAFLRLHGNTKVSFWQQAITQKFPKRQYKNGEDVIYWYCSDFHKTGKKDCVPACFKQKDIYDTLISVLKKYIINKEEICNELLSFYIQFLGEKDKQEKKLQNELNKLKIKKDKLLDLVLDGFLTKEELLGKIRNIEIQMEQIQAQINLIESKKSSKEQGKYNEILKENIFKELDVREENLENYIDELLDKILIVEKLNQSEEIKDSKQYENKAELEIKFIGNRKIII